LTTAAPSSTLFLFNDPKSEIVLVVEEFAAQEGLAAEHGRVTSFAT